MTEWGTVCVISAMVGFIIAIATPLLKLNTTLTKLNSLVEQLRHELNELTAGNREEHRAIWRKLNDHTVRLHDIDGK